MKVVLAEKPSVARDIAKVLGSFINAKAVRCISFANVFFIIPQRHRGTQRQF